jgi:hypothetical protein
MWTVVEGRMVYVPIVTHTRLALGDSHLPDTLNYINREVTRA